MNPKKHDNNIARKMKKDMMVTGMYAFLVVICITIIYPILWIVFASFNPSQSMFSSTLVPKEMSLSNYIWLFTSPDSKYLLWFRNSLKISVIVMVLQVVLVSFTAYAYSRFTFKGKKFGLLIFMVLQILPPTSAMIAFYALGILLGLVQNHAHAYLIAIYVGSAIPGNTYLVKGYLDNIPKELDEAAYLDGAGNFTTFFLIVMPLAKPILAVQALWAFMTPLQDFVIAKLIIRDPELNTLAVGLQTFVSGSMTGGAQMQFTKFAAGSLLTALPIALLFIFLQKYLISGLTAGGTKG